MWFLKDPGCLARPAAIVVAALVVAIATGTGQASATSSACAAIQSSTSAGPAANGHRLLCALLKADFKNAQKTFDEIDKVYEPLRHGIDDDEASISNHRDEQLKLADENLTLEAELEQLEDELIGCEPKPEHREHCEYLRVQIADIEHRMSQNDKRIAELEDMISRLKADQARLQSQLDQVEPQWQMALASLQSAKKAYDQSCPHHKVSSADGNGASSSQRL
jgi:chromosome segregation ATPase